MQTIYENKTKEFKVALKRSKDVNARDTYGSTALHYAAWLGRSYIQNKPHSVELLLNAGADVNARNNQNMTPLHLSAMFGEAEDVKILLERGVRTDVKNKRGNTAAEVARWRGYPDIADMIDRSRYWRRNQ